MQRVVALLAVGLTLVAAQPFQPGQNLVPLGEHISSFLLLMLYIGVFFVPVYSWASVPS